MVQQPLNQCLQCCEVQSGMWDYVARMVVTDVATVAVARSEVEAIIVARCSNSTHVAERVVPEYDSIASMNG